MKTKFSANSDRLCSNVTSIAAVWKSHDGNSGCHKRAHTTDYTHPFDLGVETMVTWKSAAVCDSYHAASTPKNSKGNSLGQLDVLSDFCSGQGAQEALRDAAVRTSDRIVEEKIHFGRILESLHHNAQAASA